MKVDIVITCELLVSIPAQFVNILAAAIASKIFFCELTTAPSSSARLFLVNKPEKRILEESKKSTTIVQKLTEYQTYLL